MKIKVEEVIIGRTGDSVVTTIDKVKTQIAFSKDVNVGQYKGKSIEVSECGQITVPIETKISK